MEQHVYCQKCGKKYDYITTSCVHCGSTSRHITMSLLETIKIRDNFRLRKKVLGFKKFAVEVMGGWFPSKDPELRDGVLQTRVIDKENNKYIHIVRDYLSGKELHKEDEKLTDHTI